MSNSRPEPNAQHIEDKQVLDFHTHLSANALGRANAVPAKALVIALKLGTNGDRLLRALAHRATEMGLLLCADNAGYFVPNGPEEVDEMVGRLRSQAAEMNERARKIESLSMQHFYSHQIEMPLTPAPLPVRV